MAYKIGDTIKATCTDRANNAWKVDASGPFEATVRYIQPDGTVYAHGTAMVKDGDKEHRTDFMLMIPQDAAAAISVGGGVSAPAAPKPIDDTEPS